MATDIQDNHGDLLAAMLSEESFLPAAPRTLEETGVSISLIESLVVKHLSLVGTCSGREIAKKLYLSPGTIKTHVHNICGKLGVRNRTEAATRAKVLGLV